MTLDTLRLKLAEALSSDALEVLCDYPERPERVAHNPFAVLSLKTLELKALGFGDPTARRGEFTFAVTVYARSGDRATEALALLSARSQLPEVRGLLAGCKFASGETEPARDGLLRAEATVSGSALVALSETDDAEFITLRLTATLV